MYLKTVHPLSLLLCLASNTLVFGLNPGRTRVSSSSNIPTKISSPSSLEFKQSAELSCTFNIDSIQIEDQPVQITSENNIEVKWSHNGQPFINYNSQTQFQSVQALGSELVTASEFDFETRTATISWSSTSLLDSGEYGCSIEILTENNQLISGSAKQQIDVYNVPSVRFSPANSEKLSFDIRREQLNNEKSKKSIGHCHVTDAFPKPEYIIVQFGGVGGVDLYIAINQDDMHQDEDTELFSIYQELSDIEIEGFRENGNVITCSVSEFGDGGVSIWGESAIDTTSMYMMEVLYLPTFVSPQIFTGAGLLEEEYILENTNVTVECMANANPPAVLSLDSELAGGSASSHNIPSLSRSGDYVFSCHASVSDPDFADWQGLTSEKVEIKVAYMDQPTVTTSNGKTNSQAILPFSKPATLSCDVNSAPAAYHFVWTKDGTVLLDESNQSLNLLASSWDDTGFYSCEAHTDYITKLSDSEKISVFGECVIKDIRTQPEVNEHGERTGGLNLKCVVDSDVRPDCVIDWMYNKNVYANGNNAVSGSLSFPNFKPENYDNRVPDITCRAKSTYHTEGVTMKIGHDKLSEFIPANNATLIVCVVILLIILIAAIAVGIYMFLKKSNSHNPDQVPSAGEIDTFSASVPTDQEVQNDPTSNAQQIQVGEIPIPVQRSEV